MNKEKIQGILSHTYMYNSIIAIVLILSISVGSLFYLGHKAISELNQKNDVLAQNLINLDQKLASSTVELAGSIEQTHSSISSELQKEKQNVSQISEQLGSYKQEVGTLSGSLSNIEKLSKLDPELLQKYSKVSFLNEHYKPVQLTEIPSEFVYSENKVLQVHSNAYPFLINMFNASKNEGIELFALSAFRSFNEQSALKSQYKVVYGAGTANQFSADQGYSEHQLGTTLDFITKGTGGSLSGFDTTKAYEWMNQNAYKYGFILSYPKNNQYYVFEPWHWRFVGVKLATDLHNQGKDFYTMDQRDIDAYLINLFD